MFWTGFWAFILSKFLKLPKKYQWKLFSLRTEFLDFYTLRWWPKSVYLTEPSQGQLQELVIWFTSSAGDSFSKEHGGQNSDSEFGTPNAWIVRNLRWGLRKAIPSHSSHFRIVWAMFLHLVASQVRFIGVIIGVNQTAVWTSYCEVPHCLPRITFLIWLTSCPLETSCELIQRIVAVMLDRFTIWNDTERIRISYYEKLGFSYGKVYWGVYYRVRIVWYHQWAFAIWSGRYRLVVFRLDLLGIVLSISYES